MLSSFESKHQAALKLIPGDRRVNRCGRYLTWADHIQWTRMLKVFRGQPPIPWERCGSFLQVAVLGFGASVSVYAALLRWVTKERSIERLDMALLGCIFCLRTLGVSLYYGRRSIYWRFGNANSLATGSVYDCSAGSSGWLHACFSSQSRNRLCCIWVLPASCWLTKCMSRSPTKNIECHV